MADSVIPECAAHPSLEWFPDQVNDAVANGEDPNVKLHMPDGWKFALSSGKRQMVLAVPEFGANAARSAYDIFCVWDCYSLSSRR